MSQLEEVIRKIEAQQYPQGARPIRKAAEPPTAGQGQERTPVWMVGEQLKDMLRNEPHLAELVDQDLDKEDMGLAECEKKIKAYADKHQSKSFACVIPAEAEKIIREFYGLPERGAGGFGTRPYGSGDSGPGVARSTQGRGKLLDLADFL